MALVRTHHSGKPRNHADCTLALGGSESNVAIGMARLGRKVRWISSLGKDVLGDMIIDVLQDEGVDAMAHRSSKLPTGLMVKTPSKGQERFVSYYRAGSAASGMDVSSVSREALADTRLMHLTGITPALSEGCSNLTRSLAGDAKAKGMTLSFDVNHRPVLWGERDPRPIYRELAGKADIIFGDREELALLVDADPSDSSALLAEVGDLGPTQVVMKRGEAGASARAEGQQLEQAAIEVEVVDTVGAGDAFVAGYLTAWLEGEPLAERLLWAAICGAQACTDAGDWEGAPTREELAAIRRELAS